jgi:hypothetical protein
MPRLARAVFGGITRLRPETQQLARGDVRGRTSIRYVVEKRADSSGVLNRADDRGQPQVMVARGRQFG